VLLISVRDLQFRRRRFVIAVLITALVFGIALVFDGVKRAVRNEPTRTVELFDVDGWVVAEDVSGPFTSTAVLPRTTVDQVRGIPGVRDAAPLVVARSVAHTDEAVDVNLVGYQRGGIGTPPVDEGRAVQRSGEVVVDRSLKQDVGSRIRLGTRPFRVVGVADDLRYFFGTPAAFVSLADAQRLVFGGADLIMAVPVRGQPEQVPAGLTVLGNDAVAQDLRRVTKQGTATIEFVTLLLWLIAVGIIGSIVYLNVLERTSEFAVLKATGTPTRSIVGGLALQSAFLSTVAGALCVGVAYLVALGLPFPAEITGGAIVRTIVVAVVVGLLAASIGARRAVTTDPALAFGGA
jgi:putative ABC transport system permease protein